jgi:hypothetical protein
MKQRSLINTGIYLTLVASVLLSSCSSKCIEDSGKHLIKDATVKPFDEIEISGPIKLVLRQDSSFAIKISADSNIIEQIKPDVSGQTFKVALDPMKYCGTDSIIIHAGIGALKLIKASGSSIIYSEGKINLADLNLDLTGAPDLNLDINAANIETEVDGAAKLTLRGQAGSHKVTSKGVLNLNAFTFVVGDYDLHIEGTGKSTINVLNDLKVNTSGATEIYYKGSPKNVSEKKAGTAKLEKVN